MDETYELYSEHYNALMLILEDMGQEDALKELLKNHEKLVRAGYTLT